MHARIALAASCMHAGAIVAYPTEAVWGLGCDPLDVDAVARLLRLKHRSWQKGLILVAANLDQLKPFICELDAKQERQLLSHSDVARTWLVPASKNVHVLLRGKHSKIAVRISDHPVVQNLCLSFGGPIVSTSANPSALPAAQTRHKVKKYFGNAVDYYVPGNIGSAIKPSQIKDLISGDILRS